MKNLYIDFDGVILDTIPPLYEYLESLNIEKSQSDKVQEAISKFNFKGKNY